MNISPSDLSHNENLDELDFAILSQLQEDGRRSFTEMAERLGVSVSTIRTRATKLIEDKTIQIVGRVNTQRVGFRAYVHTYFSTVFLVGSLQGPYTNP